MTRPFFNDQPTPPNESFLGNRRPKVFARACVLTVVAGGVTSLGEYVK